MLGAGTVAARVRSVKAQPDAQPDVPRRRRQAVSASLETPRLRLRRLVPADEADLIALDSDPDVMRHVGSPAGVKSPEETAERVKRRVLDSGRGDHGRAGVCPGLWREGYRCAGACTGAPQPVGRQRSVG